MRVVRVTKTFYETEDGDKTYFAEPLGKELSILFKCPKCGQNIVAAASKLAAGEEES